LIELSEMRKKTIDLLKSHKIWNPSQENANLCWFFLF